MSFMSDTYTFGSFAFLLYANHQWFGSHGIVAVLLVIFAIVGIAGRKSKAVHRFETNKEAIDFLKAPHPKKL